jgi:hypothetical protein
LYPPTDEEDLEPYTIYYVSDSHTRTGFLVTSEWDSFKGKGGWGESSILSTEMPQDDATSDNMYLKIGRLERRVESNEDRIDLHDAMLGLHDNRIGVLEAGMAAIQSHLTPVSNETEVMHLPIEEIKTIIKDHVEKHDDFWPDELALEHNLSVWDVLDAVEELAEEGYLEAKNKDAIPRER